MASTVCDVYIRLVFSFALVIVMVVAAAVVVGRLMNPFGRTEHRIFYSRRVHSRSILWVCEAARARELVAYQCVLARLVFTHNPQSTIEQTNHVDVSCSR